MMNLLTTVLLASALSASLMKAAPSYGSGGGRQYEGNYQAIVPADPSQLTEYDAGYDAYHQTGNEYGQQCWDSVTQFDQNQYAAVGRLQASHRARTRPRQSQPASPQVAQRQAPPQLTQSRGQTPSQASSSPRRLAAPPSSGGAGGRGSPQQGLTRSATQMPTRMNAAPPPQQNVSFPPSARPAGPPPSAAAARRMEPESSGDDEEDLDDEDDSEFDSELDGELDDSEEDLAPMPPKRAPQGPRRP